MLSNSIRELFARQVSAHAASALRVFKTDLLKLFNSDSLSQESEASLLRKVLFNFEASCSDAMAGVPALDL
ncbi:unnamed protein product, partial [Chrysoparadoxa australica]